MYLTADQVTINWPKTCRQTYCTFKFKISLITLNCIVVMDLKKLKLGYSQRNENQNPYIKITDHGFFNILFSIGHLSCFVFFYIYFCMNKDTR